MPPAILTINTEQILYTMQEKVRWKMEYAKRIFNNNIQLAGKMCQRLCVDKVSNVLFDSNINQKEHRKLYFRFDLMTPA